MKRSLIFLCFAVLLLLASVDSYADSIDDLKSPDVAVRRVAIDQIQTLDDPRIPAACLPLLNDEGHSIRRLAARAIGSRFYQIPDAERPRYLAAIQACLESRKGQPAEGNYAEFDDITLMCQRAIGLLTRRYDSPPFSVSPNGKWVLYERRRLPVIANVSNQQHYLLAPLEADIDEPDDASKKSILKTVETNLPAAQLFAPHWQPGGQALAFTLERLEKKFYHPILVWSAKAPSHVVVLDEPFFASVLERDPQWGDTTEFVAWKADKALIRIYCAAYPAAGRPLDPGVIVSYNVRTGKIAAEH